MTTKTPRKPAAGAGRKKASKPARSEDAQSGGGKHRKPGLSKGKKAAKLKSRKRMLATKARERARARRQRRKDGTAGPTEEQMRTLPNPPGEGKRKKAAGKKARPIPQTKKFGAVRPKKNNKRRRQQPQIRKDEAADDRNAPRDDAKRSSGPRPDGRSKPSGKPQRSHKPQRSDKPQHSKPQHQASKPQQPSHKRQQDSPKQQPAVKHEPAAQQPVETAAASAKPSTPAATQTPPPAVAVANGFAQLKGVHAKTAEALYEQGLTTPFPIQSAVIPSASRGRDMLVKSPTGSGKTLAFGLPIIEQAPENTGAPFAVILAPTRELAVQVSEDLTPIAKGKNLWVAPVFGGAPVTQQAKRARRAAIVVATPGRLADLMRTKRIDLSGVQVLVLDEADRMLDMGFQPQVDEIADQLPKPRQTLLFSATLDGAVGKIAKKYTTDPETVRNDKAVGEGNKINHVLLATTTSTKVDTVLDALDVPDRDLAVVFVRTKRGADRLNQRLKSYGLRSTTIHGGMTQPQRLREYKRFQASTCDVLVATDVFARGMDLDRITHVINYDLPEDADTYQHRTGRTGRAGRTGTAISMVLPNQKKFMKQIARSAGLPSDITNNYKKPSGKKWQPLSDADRAKVVEAQRKKDGYGTSRGGSIANYNDEKGFGFITPDEGVEDVFFHRSAVKRDSGFAIARGATVSYDLDETEDRGRASSVELLDGRREYGNRGRGGSGRSSSKGRRGNNNRRGPSSNGNGKGRNAKQRR